MKRASTCCLITLGLISGMGVAQGPSMEEVVRSPENFAGKTLEFQGASLSGALTRYDAAGVRKYYLNVRSRDKVFEVGFFLAPPALADRLAEKLDPRRNYGVNLTCRIERITINNVPQWHGIVTRVDLLGDDGRVTETIKEGK